MAGEGESLILVPDGKIVFFKDHLLCQHRTGTVSGRITQLKRVVGVDPQRGSGDQVPKQVSTVRFVDADSQYGSGIG